MMRRIQSILRGHIYQWSYTRDLDISRHGEFLQINASMGQSRCIKALNRTLPTRGSGAEEGDGGEPGELILRYLSEFAFFACFALGLGLCVCVCVCVFADAWCREG